MSVSHDFATEQEPPFRKVSPQTIVGGLALAGITLACSWIVYANLFAPHPVDIMVAPTVTILASQPAPPAVPVPEARPAATTEPDVFTAPVLDASLLHETHELGFPPVAFSLTEPPQLALQFELPPARQVVEIIPPPPSVPVPTPRPAELAQTRKPVAAPASEPRTKIAEATTGDSFFAKLFGIGRSEDPKPTLAYAAPDGGVFGNGQSITPGKLPTADAQTAVYDITARTVYMPDGTKLEAHSGLGSKLDDPRYVHVKMHGATPPHTYDLVPREALFHGVEALRLIPVGGEGAIYGRRGLLAHTFMLGPNGDSNGCVSFRNYDAFLRAYKNGKVKRLIVVSSMRQMASN